VKVLEAAAETGGLASARRQTAFIIPEIPADAEEIRFLTNVTCALEDACRPLENFVPPNYTIIEEKDFYKEKVRLLRRKR
jgi:hypothetical protein